jgi:D-inositol-3-phosphate glycosyltransferase
MKVLIVGDSPTVSTGFARCTLAACEGLLAAGHRPIVLGINEFGGPNSFPFDIHPCIHPLDQGRDAFGCSRLPLLIDRERPDVVLILQDGWNIAAYFSVLDSYFKDAPELVPPICGWIAVDSKNQLAKPLNRLAHVMVWTQFGADELKAGGYEGSTAIVPLGVDHSVFYPRDKAESRKQIGIDEGLFVVGGVGRNQHRKNWPLALRALAEWTEGEPASNDDRRLLLHVAPTGDVGCNLRALIRFYGLQGRVLISEPHIGKGVDNSALPALYSAMDCYLSVSYAEGWNLCATEAMACGIPCVLPRFAATGETGWTGNAALTARCYSHQLTAPMNTLAYTVGMVPDLYEVIDAIDALWRDYPKDASIYRGRSLACAAQFSWQRTGAMVVSELEAVVARHNQQRADREQLSQLTEVRDNLARALETIDSSAT